MSKVIKCAKMSHNQKTKATKFSMQTAPMTELPLQNNSRRQSNQKSMKELVADIF